MVRLSGLFLLKYAKCDWIIGSNNLIRILLVIWEGDVMQQHKQVSFHWALLLSSITSYSRCDLLFVNFQPSKFVST